MNIRRELSNIIDPETGADIISSGRVVRLEVTEQGAKLTLAAKTAKSATAEQLKQFAILHLSMLDGIGDVSVNLESKPIVPIVNVETPGPISKVKNIVAVSSCKGGVGKSTVAVNLAYTMSQLGLKVGILDADIYGPSLPTMTKPTTDRSIYSGQSLVPLEYENVKLMSMGFINKGAAIMRGPMVNQILNQLVTLTAWGELDYLILDMPPGTGDIQLTLAQIMNISAAVIVTTPQRLSFVDVVKGIDMFDTVNVPCVAVVENMAEYSTYSFSDDFFAKTVKSMIEKVNILSTTSEDIKEDAMTNILKEAINDRKQPRKLFGDGHLSRLREMWGMDHLISLPLQDNIASSGDSGRPYILTYPKSEEAKLFKQLADSVMKEVDKMSLSEQSNKVVEFNSSENEFSFQGKMIKSKSLRCICRCATCVEEMTGRKLLKDDTISDSIKPLGMAPIGRYAWSIDWSDGHKSLYPFKQILAESQAKLS